MKKVLLFVVLVISIWACKKDKVAESPVAGEWTWERSVGGFSGSDTLKPTPANSVVLTFRKNYTYTVTINNTVTNEGTYFISAPADLPIIQFSNLPGSVGGLFIGSNGVSFNRKNNTLELIDEYISEGYTHHFTMSANQ